MNIEGEALTTHLSKLGFFTLPRGKQKDSWDIVHQHHHKAPCLVSTRVDTIICNFSNGIFGFVVTPKRLLIFNKDIGAMKESKGNWWFERKKNQEWHRWQKICSWGWGWGRGETSCRVDWVTSTKKSSMFAQLPTTSNFWALCFQCKW